MTPLLLPMPGNEPFAAALGTEMSWQVGEIDTRRFPDGETYLRVGTDCSARSVAVVCTLDRPDEKVLPLLFCADALRDLGARRVGLVAPYLAYMRQDQRFRPGEAITSRSFAALLSRHLDWLVTVDPHLHRVPALSAIYAIPSRVVHAAPALAAWIAGNVERPLIVGPDEESEQWVADVARRAAAPHLVLQKTRRGDRDVDVSVPSDARDRDRTPVVVDDIVSSARTMAAATRRLVDAGFRAPICVGVHAVFSDDAELALRDAGAQRIVTTGTIPHASNAIAIEHLLAPAVRDSAATTPTRFEA